MKHFLSFLLLLGAAMVLVCLPTSWLPASPQPQPPQAANNCVLSVGGYVVCPSGGSEQVLVAPGGSSLPLFTGSPTFQQLTLSGLGSSTNPICPNGTGGALTLTGCATGSAPAGTICQPLINTNGSTGYGTSPLFCDASQFSGASLDVQLNKATAQMVTNGGGIVDMRALAGSQSIVSLVQLGEPLAPALSTTSASSPCGSGTCVVKVVYTLSAAGCGGECNGASQEAEISISTSQTPVVTAPTYTGSATGWNVYLAVTSGGTANSWSELKCNVSALTLGVNYTIPSSCSGSQISKLNYNIAWIFPSVGSWSCTMTGGNSDCVEAMNRADLEGSATGSSSTFSISATSTTNVATTSSGVVNVPGALLGTDPNPKSGASSLYVRMVGLTVYDLTSSAVVPSSLRIANTSDSSVLRDVSAENSYGCSAGSCTGTAGPYGTGGCAIWGFSVGYAVWHNIHADDNNGEGEYGLCAGAAGAGLSSVSIDHLISVHAAASNLYYWGGTFVLDIGTLTMEGNDSLSNCSNKMVDIAPGATQLDSIHIGTFEIGANCPSSTATAVTLESNASQIDIDRINIGGMSGMTCITNNVAGYTTTPLTFAQCSSSGGNKGTTGFHFSRTAPVFASGLQIGNTPSACAIGSSCAVVAATSGAFGFEVTVGTTPSTTGTITFPLASKFGYRVNCDDMTTTTETGRTTALASTTQSTLTFFNNSGTATAPTAGDTLICSASMI